MSGAPDGGAKIEVEFVAGTWTDVSAWVDWSAGVSTKYGRTTVFSQPQSATLDFTLDNTDGRFSPLQQTLSDGVTAHPYWPNVVPKKRVRLSYTSGGITYYRAWGKVRGWPQSTKNNRLARVAISCVDRLERLSRVQLDQALRLEVLADNPNLYWPLSDQSGAAGAAEVQTATARNALQVVNPASTGAVSFGASGPGGDNGTAVQFAPQLDPTTSGGLTSGRTWGQVLNGAPAGAPDPTGPYTLEVWFNAGTVPPAGNDGSVLGLFTATPAQAYVNIDRTSGALTYVLVAYPNGTASVEGVALSTPNLWDGKWHHLVARRTASALQLYLDGTLAGTAASVLADQHARIGQVVVGDQNYPTNNFGNTSGYPLATRFPGAVAHLALYSFALSATRISVHHSAGIGWAGEAVDDRLTRWLTAAGVATADLAFDSSAVVLDSYAQSSKDILTAAQDEVTTEGGGAAFYDAPDGHLRFVNRYAGITAATPDLVLDGPGDLDGPSFTPAYDDTRVVTRVTGTRYNAAATASTFVVDTGAAEVVTDQVASNALADSDALALTQLRLARQRTPAYRVDQVVVDLWTAQTAGLYAGVAGASEIGKILQLTNVPTQLGPAGTIDLVVQGWADAITDSSYTVTFDTDSADLLPPLVWGGTGDDSRWQAKGQTVTSALTAAATSLSISTSAGNPTFTTSAGAYPLSIVVDAEVITLTSAPSGSSSPQTFTGVTRGVVKRGQGGPAAAHAAGVTVQLAPASTWTI